MAQLRSHHLGHSKAFKNGILSELPPPTPTPRGRVAAAWTDNQSDLICNPPSENPGYGPGKAILRVVATILLMQYIHRKK